MKVAVFGLGYVGTVTAAVLASNGHDVWGVDVDASKADTVARGSSTVVEPGLEELVASTVASGRLRATTDLALALEEAELSLVCVGTPSSPTGSTDLSYVIRAVSDIADTLTCTTRGTSVNHSIVVRSTVPPGTLETQLAPVVAARLPRSPVTIGVGTCPEFLREGTAITDFYDAPITVVGTDDPQVERTMRDLFSFLDGPIHIVPPRQAEGLKYACNAFHAVKVSFANELGRLYRLLGVDARQVMALFCEDTRLNLSANYLAPGFAFGGSCLPKDLRSLLFQARVNFLDLPLLSAALTTNELSVSEVVNRVLATDARSVALLGLSFKMDSDDLRESPYVDLAETLIGKGFDVRIYDPIVDPSNLIGANRKYINLKLPHLQRVLKTCPTATLEKADLALVSSSHPSVVSALMANPPGVIFDLSGRLGPEVEALTGYEGVAW